MTRVAVWIGRDRLVHKNMLGHVYPDSRAIMDMCFTTNSGTDAGSKSCSAVLCMRQFRFL